MKRIARLLTAALIMTIFAGFGVFAYAEDGTACAVTNEAELAAALTNASTDAAAPTEILVTEDIVLTNSVTLPRGSFAYIRGDAKERKITYAGATDYTSGSALEAKGLLTIYGEAVIESLTLDACQLRRTVAVNGSNAALTLNNGAVITGGRLGDKTNKGAGVYIKGTKGKNARLIVNAGAAVTGNTDKAASSGSTEYITKVDGIGVYADSYADILIDGGSISYNQDISKTVNPNLSTSGAGVYVGANCTLLMNSGSIDHNISHGDGGGIFSIGQVEINGGTITANEAASSGGGIYVASQAILNGGSITKNKACIPTNAANSSRKPYGCGGGVMVAGSGKFVMNAGSVLSNTAETKVSDYLISCNAGQGGGIYIVGKALINGGKIRGNRAAAAAGNNNKAGHGGGIAVEGGISVGEVAINKVTMDSNTAAGFGKDVFINEVDTHENSGNGLQTTHEAGIPVICGPAKITDFYMEAGSVIYISDSIEGSDITLDIAGAKSGTTVAEPAGDYVIEPADARALKTSNGLAFKLTSGKITYTSQVEQGTTDISGAITGAMPELTYTGKALKPEPEVSLEGTLLRPGTDYVLKYYSNTDAGTGTVKILGNGKYTGSLTCQFLIKPKDISGVKLVNPGSRLYTGAEITPDVRVYDGRTLLINDEDYTVEYSNNIQLGTGSIKITGKGNYQGTANSLFQIKEEGDLTIAADQTELEASIAKAAGSADQPAEIYIDGSISLSKALEIPAGKYIRLTGTGNDALLTGSGFGESMIICKGSLTIDQLTIDAAQKGRAVSVEEGGTLNIDSASLIRNGKASSGTGAGGGILNKGTLRVYDGEITGCIAKVGAGINNAGTAEISGGTISGNTASGSEANGYPGKGGGVYSSGKLILGDVSISANTSTEYGGGVYNDGQAELEGAGIEGNSAPKAGAGIFTADTLTMKAGTVANNTVKASTLDRVYSCGGGVFVSKGSFKMAGGSIENNSAVNTYFSNQYTASVGNGGGVYVNNSSENPGVFTMTGGSIKGNTAKSKIADMTAGHGGGVFVMGGRGSDGTIYSGKEGSFNMLGGEISGNKASNAGAGVYITSKEFAENLSSFTPSFNIEFGGQAHFALGGNATVTGNENDNLVLQDEAVVSVKSALTGKIRMISGSKGDFSFASGSGSYVLTDTDAKTFVNEKGKRSVALSGGELRLQTIDITELYTARCLPASRLYDGTDFKPEIKIEPIRSTTKALASGAYKIKYPKTAIDAGTYTVTVTGTGDYSGSFKLKYYVTPVNLSKVTVKTLPVQTFTGSAIKYTPVLGRIVYGNKKLARGTDYSIKSYSNNVKTGKATIVLSGLDNYQGTTKAYFIIKPAKGSISKLTAGSKAVRVAVKSQKTAGATGYQVAYKLSTASSYKTAGTTTLTRVIKNLRTGKLYNFKVRAYKTVDGKKYYGAWSTVKSIKAK